MEIPLRNPWHGLSLFENVDMNPEARLWDHWQTKEKCWHASKQMWAVVWGE